MELHIVINGRKDLAAQLYQQLREAIADVAHKKKWFKEQRLGRAVSPMPKP